MLILHTSFKALPPSTSPFTPEHSLQLLFMMNPSRICLDIDDGQRHHLPFGISKQDPPALALYGARRKHSAVSG
jgi:hypothetical protein